MSQIEFTSVHRHRRDRQRIRPSWQVRRVHPARQRRNGAHAKNAAERAGRRARNARTLLSLRARSHGNVAQTADAALGGWALRPICASPDTADCASEIVEQDLAESAWQRGRSLEKDRGGTPAAIEDGTYGRCRRMRHQDSGGPVGGHSLRGLLACSARHDKSATPAALRVEMDRIPVRSRPSRGPHPSSFVLRRCRYRPMCGHMP